jgi:hypothetical protein
MEVSSINEKYRVREGKNSVLRRMFGIRKEEVTGGLKELHNEELHNCYLLLLPWYYSPG